VRNVASIRGPTSPWRELQTWSHYAYIVSEGAEPNLQGMQIVDLAVPQQPRLIGAFTATFTTAHTIHIADGFAYLNGTDNGWRILDLADPEHPRDVGSWHGRYVHDCFVRGDRAYLANIQSGGFTILDVSNRSQPQEIGFTSYFGAATHNCWTSDDGDYLFTTDETGGGHLRVWDVREPARAVQVGDWSASGNASIHNVVVKGDSAYIAYYTEGVHVLDVSQPTLPRPVGYYDTFPGASGGFNGAWGVYPFARNGRIYVSDIQSGLFVLEMTTEGQPPADFQVEAPQSQIVVPGQSQLWLFFDIFNNAGGPRRFDLAATNSAGWPLDVPPFIDVPNAGIEAVMVTVHVPAGLATPVRAGVELCATPRATDVTRCAETRIAVPVVLRSFTAEVTGDGVALRWRLERDAADRGRLEVQRARVTEPGATPGTFEWRAGLDLGAGSWLDRDVEPGAEYVYRLLLAAETGTHVLGVTRISLAAPARSRLLGAAPNPFNPTTRIRFELGRAGAIEITIHDARGRLVRRLTAGSLEAGEHALVWDGRDAHGAPQPSGIYLYEVRSGAWTAHGRMTLAK
jgi:choice-of-anchor B domain-containing protein